MAAVSKAEYLKRYMSSSTDDEKKKKRKKKLKVPQKFARSVIVDDDVHWSDLTPKGDEAIAKETEFDDAGDEAPVLYDEDGVETISMDRFKKREDDLNSKWAPINMKTLKESDSKDLIEDVSQEITHAKRTVSPVTKTRADTPDNSPPRRRRAYTPDNSPPRRRRADTPDNSPPRRRRQDTPDNSPSKRRKTETHDNSPLRRRRADMLDNSPHRRRRDNTPDNSPPRRRRQGTPDNSPCRRRRADTPDNSPPRRRRQGTADNSPPRRRRADTPDNSPPRRRRADTPDNSPPRQRRQGTPDNSPPRPRMQGTPDNSPRRQRRADTPDYSPSRKRRADMPDNEHPRGQRPGISSSKHTSLEDKKAGLLSAQDLKRENELTRKREAELFTNMDASISGRGTKTVHRDKAGRKRDLEAEEQKKKEEEVQKAKDNEKFNEWGRGVAQTKAAKDKMEDFLHEASKPLARYKDDKDLDAMLKDKEREDDPMLAYMQKKNAVTSKKSGVKAKPTYKGPAPQPNRFRIQPGYRWDGVDRSNGFEKKRFAMLSNKKAVDSIAHKWSIEDM